MQVVVTNIASFPVVLNQGPVLGPYSLAAGATSPTLTLPDSEEANLRAMRNDGLITYIFSVFPNAPPEGLNLGRTMVTGTAYTVMSSDSGCVLECVNASAQTITLPANIGRGVEIRMTQAGAGKVSPVAGSGATVHFPGAVTGTKGQWSVIRAYVRDNSGASAAEWVVSGDLA